MEPQAVLPMVPKKGGNTNVNDGLRDTEDAGRFLSSSDFSDEQSWN